MNRVELMIHTRRIMPLLLCVLIVAGTTGCTPDDAGEVSGPATAEVTRGDITVEVTASGNLAFSQEEELAFDMAGTVEEVYVEEGDSVSEGQVVATLDTTDWEKQLRSLQLSVLSARISLKQAQKALDEAEAETIATITGDVVVRDCCDDDEIEIREMQVEQAQLRLEDAQASLDEHLQQSPEVASTFDGFVTMVGVEGGDEVFSGSVAAVVADPNQFEALILVSENDIGKVDEGTQAEVGVDAISGLVLPAEVTHVAPTASISSGVVNYQVTIQVASLDELQMGQNQQREVELHEGMSVTVTLYPAQKSGVLLVPNAAISVVGGRHVVTVVDDDGTEEQRRIVTGISDWRNTEVVEGLEEGETVLLPEGSTATEQQQSGFVMMGGGRPNP